MSESDSSPKKNDSKAAVFARRLGSTVVLLGVVFYGLLSGGILSVVLVGGLIMLLNVVGLLEFYGMVKDTNCRGSSGWALPVEWCCSGRCFCISPAGRQMVWLGPPALAGVTELEGGNPRCFSHLNVGVESVGSSGPIEFLDKRQHVLGVLYVSWLLGFVLKIFFFKSANGAPEGAAFDGGFCLLFFILVTKCSDIGAYSLGSLIGRHKMIPKVSPGKTWEGFAGAILLSTAVALVFAHYFGATKLGGMTLTHAAVLGPLMAVGAVVGDLVESVFKRDSGVKDSGSFFPGIGGILDLLDSLLFNAPLMFLYLRLVLFND